MIPSSVRQPRLRPTGLDGTARRRPVAVLGRALQQYPAVLVGDSDLDDARDIVVVLAQPLELRGGHDAIDLLNWNCPVAQRLRIVECLDADAVARGGFVRHGPGVFAVVT